jgi:hypothetical protein
MSWGFEIGRTYNRRADIHARFGGQQQGGIITPAHHPLVIISSLARRALSTDMRIGAELTACLSISAKVKSGTCGCAPVIGP